MQKFFWLLTNHFSDTLKFNEMKRVKFSTVFVNLEFQDLPALPLHSLPPLSEFQLLLPTTSNPPTASKALLQFPPPPTSRTPHQPDTRTQLQPASNKVLQPPSKNRFPRFKKLNPARLLSKPQHHLNRASPRNLIPLHKRPSKKKRSCQAKSNHSLKVKA